MSCRTCHAIAGASRWCPGSAVMRAHDSERTCAAITALESSTNIAKVVESIVAAALEQVHALLGRDSRMPEDGIPNPADPLPLHLADHGAPSSSSRAQIEAALGGSLPEQDLTVEEFATPRPDLHAAGATAAREAATRSPLGRLGRSDCVADQPGESSRGIVTTS